MQKKLAESYGAEIFGRLLLQLDRQKLNSVTHICWAIGGRLVPDEVWGQYMETFKG